MHFVKVIITYSIVLLALSACGQKGPLYFPEAESNSSEAEQEKKSQKKEAKENSDEP